MIKRSRRSRATTGKSKRASKPKRPLIDAGMDGSRRGTVASPKRRDAKERVERIVNATVTLLADRQPADISMSQIAELAGISRTTIYGFFPTTFSIFETLSRKYIAESIHFVREQSRKGSPTTIEEVLNEIVDSTVLYFNATPAACTLLSSGGLDMRSLEQDYDIVIAEIFHDLFDASWPVKKFSERDPFRTLSILLCALFIASIARYHCVSPFMAEQAKIVAKEYLSGFLRSISYDPASVFGRPSREREIKSR